MLMSGTSVTSCTSASFPVLVIHELVKIHCFIVDVIELFNTTKSEVLNVLLCYMKGAKPLASVATEVLKINGAVKSTIHYRRVSGSCLYIIATEQEKQNIYIHTNIFLTYLINNQATLGTSSSVIILRHIVRTLFKYSNSVFNQFHILSVQCSHFLQKE